MPFPDAASRRAEPAPMTNLFVGSTAKDLGAYRREVKVGMESLEVSVNLSEDWSGDWAEVDIICRERLARADAYYGIFGHWYGSIVNGGDASITCREFRWARDQWEGQRNRIAVFLPELGSKADQDLNLAAQKLMENLPDDTTRERFRRLQAEFIRECEDSHRRVNRFLDPIDLRYRAMAVAYAWLRRTVDIFDSGGGADLSPAVLGSIGRGMDFHHIHSAMGRAATIKPPAICLLLHGREDDGHKYFFEFVKTRLPAVSTCRDGRLHYAKTPLGKLIRILAEACGHDVHKKPVETIDDLMRAIFSILKKQNIVLFLERLHFYDGGVSAFQAELWAPLFDALDDQRQKQPIAHRLILVGSVFRPSSLDNDSQWPPASQPTTMADYRRLLLLPPLRPLTRDDVGFWCEGVGLTGERFDTVVNTAICDPETGDDDGTPLRVYNRLQLIQDELREQSP